MGEARIDPIRQRVCRSQGGIMNAKREEKSCSSCGAVVINTEQELGNPSFAVTSGKDSNGCVVPVVPSTSVGQCWHDGICPCCGMPNLGNRG